MANAIDRLRVEGVSPTRENTCVSRENTLPPPVVPNSGADKPWVAHGDSFYMSGKQTSSKDFLTTSSNSAARRMEVLTRMRTANQGLSSMDSHISLTPLKFVLRGTTVKNSLERQVTIDVTKLLPNRTVPIQRAATHDGYEREIKVHIAKARSEPITTGQESGTHVRDDDSLPPFSAQNVMLGPAHMPSYGVTYSGRKMCRSSDGFELTGHKMKGFDTSSSRIGYGEVYPHIDTPVRAQRRWTRNAIKDGQSSVTVSNPESLKQCLHIQQSITLPLTTHEEEIKLKHFTQCVRKDAKASFNNPYRKIKKRERRIIKKNDRQYQFDSVSSYVHFNRIYQQPSVGRSIAVHVPQLAGFPAHCTDTVLLRMMIEMNRPVRKSPDKNSDIAVHRDLDEFLMVRTPSAFSKTGSSKKTVVRSGRRSGQSNVDTAIEEEAGCAWAAARVADVKESAELGPENEDQDQEASAKKQQDHGADFEGLQGEHSEDKPQLNEANDEEHYGGEQQDENSDNLGERTLPI